MMFLRFSKMNLAQTLGHPVSYFQIVILLAYRHWVWMEYFLIGLKLLIWRISKCIFLLHIEYLAIYFKKCDIWKNKTCLDKAVWYSGKRQKLNLKTLVPIYNILLTCFIILSKSVNIWNCFTIYKRGVIPSDITLLGLLEFQ